MLYRKGESTIPKGTEHTVDIQYIYKKKIHLHLYVYTFYAPFHQ